MPPPLPRRSIWTVASLISSRRISLPRKGCRVGLRIVLFEACSAFTRVAACTLALPPIRDTLIEGFSHFVTSMTAPIASGRSGRRVGLAPTGKRRLVTAHTAFCDNSACPTFQVAKYLRDLRRYLPAVPPISTNQLQALHASRDYKGMVRLIKRAMNIETDIRVVWVSKGEAEDAKIKHAPAWIRLPSEMPPYGSEAFQQLRIDIFLRRSFLEQSQFDEP